MNIYIKVFHISLFIICPLLIYGQSLSNASLEDRPADATMPSGWFAIKKGTTPDILPGYWGVYNVAYDGETYVGLITRTDGSNESIGQRMVSPLDQNACYELSLQLAHSDNYSGYNKPIQLKVWLSSKKSKKEQLIFQSPTIDSEEWETFKIDFYPEKNMKYFILEAYNPTDVPQEGNILIDHILGPKICNKA